ncbi:MAG: hypothetical protein K9W46_02000 [Candidatus Heimdallarchaeum endolithica]|uniref:Uncharacterized protein n=1 Tax=Candidatus Heimdallarchaeum endolithica TaxID=2876572 RepID=A0A9Y1BTA8_9ARCH|nr:MAG: hypothetical protein K9W46_02000 [Candidatus Heimdallarchaeum endolithica]
MVENNFLNDLNNFLKEFSLESSKILKNIKFFFSFFSELNKEIEKSNFSAIDKKLVSYSFEAFDLTIKKTYRFIQDNCLYIFENKQDYKNDVKKLDTFETIVKEIYYAFGDFYLEKYNGLDSFIKNNKIEINFKIYSKFRTIFLRLLNQIQSLKQYIIDDEELNKLTSWRKTKLQELFHSATSINLDKLAEILHFDNSAELEQWIMQISNDIFVIDDNILKISRSVTDDEIAKSIDSLLNEFKKYETLGLGKKI